MGKHKRGLAEAEDLNLVPIMNLVTILIPFLLMAAQFISLTVIDSTLPAIGPPQPVEEEPEKPPLNLSIAITDEGFTIMGADAVLNPGAPADAAPVEGEAADKGPTVPCKESGCPTAESYDLTELRRYLNMIKDEYPTDENVILVPEPRIQYEVLVVTMDATREDPNRKEGGKARLLFPFVVIAGGAE
jgi:hypothetical protein